MCSVAEDEFDEVKLMNIEPAITNLNDIDCRKCNLEKASIILRKKDPYCKQCFLISVVHKFRASLGKAKLIRPKDHVLIAFSGDAASCALLNLVQSGLSESTHKKLRFEPILIYVDDSIIKYENEEERMKRQAEVIQLMKSSSIPGYVASMNDALNAEANYVDINENLPTSEELNLKLKSLFATTSSLTAKLDLLKKLRRSVLIKCAETLQCSFILFADTANKLAATLLTSVSLGGGSHLSPDVGFCDARNDKIKILRPMRDFMSDDLNHYIDLNSIAHLNNKSLAKDDNPYASIQSLTNKFVKDLQENFPSTISTVLRTGEKMECKGNVSVTEEETCALCKSHLDTDPTTCSALQATEYSRMISNKQRNPTVNGDISKCSDCSCSILDGSVTRSEVESFLCYSCRLITRDVKNIDLLPPSLLSTIRINKSLQNTRSMIEDFLL